MKMFDSTTETKIYKMQGDEIIKEPEKSKDSKFKLKMHLCFNAVQEYSEYSTIAGLVSYSQ